MKYAFVIKLTAFISGASVMILEIAGARLIAPYLGTSIIVWTSLIGLILGALSLGYYVGGIISDQKPSLHQFMYIVFWAGCFTTFVFFVREPLLQSLMGIDIRQASLIAIAVLFVIPSILFGMIAPYAIKLHLHDISRTGHVSGGLYALSTIGSITGTFLAGYFLLPIIPTPQLILFLGFFLMAYPLVFFVFYKQKHMQTFLLHLSVFLVLVLLSVWSMTREQPSYVLAHINTPYNTFVILEGEMYEQPVRVLKSGPMYHSAIHSKTKDLVFEYAKQYRLDTLFHPHISSGLFLGAGAYTIIADILHRHEQIDLDVVEIDNQLIDIAKAYFFFEQEQDISLFHEDARTFLNKLKMDERRGKSKKYDVIYMDTFLHHFHIPFQLTTKETAELLKNALHDDGILMINVIASLQGKGSWFTQSYYKTLKTQFDHIAILPVSTLDETQIQNILFIVKKTPFDFSHVSEEQKTVLSSLILEENFYENGLVLTDNFAPIEYYMKSF